MPEHGTIAWTELNSWDVAKSKIFYENIMGWTFSAVPMPEGTYWLAMAGDQQVAGLFEMTAPQFTGLLEHWFTYFEVDDVDARIEQARKAGAEIIRMPFDVPEVGRIAILKDSGGAAMGWISSAQRS